MATTFMSCLSIQVRNRIIFFFVFFFPFFFCLIWTFLTSFLLVYHAKKKGAVNTDMQDQWEDAYPGVKVGRLMWITHVAVPHFLMRSSRASLCCSTISSGTNC